MNSRLQALRSIDDLARLLGVSRGVLDFLAYGNAPGYHTVSIPKRRGGVRRISQPHPRLKRVQRAILPHLASMYRPRSCVHGFVQGRSIATNAAAHVRMRWVLNLDLRDFFPSVHFGRVRGMLSKSPYQLDQSVATVLAQLCTDEDALPQGAPTSPILSNMVCGRLDSELTRLAKRFSCAYTRYADDITLSTDRAVFPAALATIDEASHPPATVAGPLLSGIIESNGFVIANDKVRLQRYDERQEVTGLIVNDFPNVRRSFRSRIRAMLHAWGTHGLEAAEAEFLGNYDTKHRGPYADPTFRAIVKGNIDFLGMIRGVDHPWYDQFCREFAELDSQYRVRPKERRRRNHLKTELDAIWVIESDELIADPEQIGQGSAFELDGFGLVTCAHCVLRKGGDGTWSPVQDLVAYQPHAARFRQRARVRVYDVARDLAILELESPSGVRLRPHRQRARPGDRIRVRGYPDHSIGASDWQDRGVVTQLHHHMASPRLLVSCPIVAGASGSPVFNERSRVVGVASLGADAFQAAAQRPMVRYGVIPIDLVAHLGGDA